MNSPRLQLSTPPPAREGSAHAVTAESLERLRQLTSAPLDETSAPRVLAELLEAAKVRHGALLRYDSDMQCLSLLAEEGLAPQAVDAVRLIRRGVSGVWDMPLHAVLQRRVYIIDKPKENPFVPTLLSGGDSGVLTNAAVMPLFAGGSVTGALLVVGSGKRVIHEADIVGLREAAKLIGVALRPAPKLYGRGVQAAAPATSAPAAREEARDRAAATARISELEALVESLRRAASGAPSAADADRRLGELTRERDRYKSEASLGEIALKNLRSEYDVLHELSISESERAQKLALELARVREELAAGAESGQRSRGDLEQAKQARAEVAERLTALERQLADTAKQLHTGEAGRAQTQSRLSGVEREADELRRSLRGREEQIAEIRSERERLTASLQNAMARYQDAEDANADLREATELAQAEVQVELEALRARVEVAERQRDRMSAGLAGRDEIVSEIERETEKFRVELAREVERRRVAEQTSSSVIHDAVSMRTEAARMQSELATSQAESERARGEAERLATDLSALRVAAQTRGEDLRQRLGDLESRAAQTESVRQSLSAELERLRPDLEAYRRGEAESRAREAERVETERKVTAEIAAVRTRLDETSEAVRTLTRERDSLQARATTLQDTTTSLFDEGKALRTEREQRDQQLEQARAAAAREVAETARLRREVEGLDAAAQRSTAELAGIRQSHDGALVQSQALERELAALREELERAQSRGSELTAELARRAEREASLEQASAATRAELEASEQRRVEDELQRQELQARLELLESALQGASTEIAEKARQVDFASVLRATLAKSESNRRTAEEAVARLEAALAAERQTSATARAEADGEREAAQELALRIEEIERKLAAAEDATGDAEQRAADLAAEQSAAQEATQSLAAELGRRTADLDERTGSLEAARREVSERQTVVEQSLARITALEGSARAAGQQIEALKRQSSSTQDEKDRRAHELELRVAEAAARAERTAADAKAAGEERDRLRESVSALENERRQAGEDTREAAAKATALEAAAHMSRSESERLQQEADAARQRAATLETDVRKLETKGDRWQTLAEKLQARLEERDREILTLKTAPRAVVQTVAAAAAAQGSTSPPAPAAERPPIAPKVPLGKPIPVQPKQARAPVHERLITNRNVVILDDPGPSFSALAEICTNGGFDACALENGHRAGEPPAYTAVNLLAAQGGGLEGLMRSRTDEGLAGSSLFLYATRPGTKKGIVFPNVDCLIRPIEEKDFLVALSTLLGSGKRVTIIGEELDRVLKLNAWATAKGCSVSSAGDLKQGAEILDIVKPDLIVFDFSRLGGEGAGLVVKVRRTARLESLPILLVLPPGGQSPSAGFFLKRLSALADETPLDLSPVARRLTPAEKR